MNLLVFVIRYPPDRSVVSRRWGNLVENLQSFGVNCTVVTIGGDSSVLNRGKTGERILRISGSKDDKALKKKSLVKNGLFKFGKRLFFYFSPETLFSRSITHWRNIAKQNSLLITLAQESDIIISSYGPSGPFIVGKDLAKKLNKPWVADIRDSFESRDGYNLFINKRFSRYVEGKVVRSAALRITIGATLAEILSKKYNQMFIAIYNGWVENDLVRNRIKYGSRSSPYLYYAGSIYKHRIPAFLILFKALQKFPDIKIRIRLLNDYSKGAFQVIYQEYQDNKQIELLPPTDQKIVDHELARSLGVLVVESISNDDALRNGTITGKLIGLLVSGIPGIAISSEKGEIRQIVNKVSNWYGVDNVEQCIVAIEKLLGQENILSDNRKELEEYHMKQQAELLYSYLKTIEKGGITIDHK